MQALKMLTELQLKFLVQMNSYHRSKANDRDGKYKMNHITKLKVDSQNQSLIVIYNNVAIFRYTNFGAIIKIK